MDPGIISTLRMRDGGVQVLGEALDLGVWNIGVAYVPSSCATGGGALHVLYGFLSFHLKK